MSPKASGWYRDVTAMVVSYLTDRDQLARYLPEPFEVGEEALVSVFYTCNRRVDWLAGHGYDDVVEHDGGEAALGHGSFSGAPNVDEVSGKPMRRSRSWKRGSERRGSRRGSVFALISSGSCSS